MLRTAVLQVLDEVHLILINAHSYPGILSGGRQYVFAGLCHFWSILLNIIPAIHYCQCLARLLMGHHRSICLVKSLWKIATTSCPDLVLYLHKNGSKCHR